MKTKNNVKKKKTAKHEDDSDLHGSDSPQNAKTTPTCEEEAQVPNLKLFQGAPSATREEEDEEEVEAEEEEEETRRIVS